MIQRTFQSICLISCICLLSQTFSIIFAKKTQKKMTLLSEEPELRSEFSKFAHDHPFEIKHGNNGLKFSNNFASDSNIKIPTVPRKTENPSLIPPDVWSSKVSSRDDSRKNTIILPEELPHESWHVLQEEPETPRKSRRQRARERDGFRRYPPPRTGDLTRDKIPWGRPGKQARQRGMLGYRRRILREQHGKLHASWGHNGDSRRGRPRKQKEVPRAPWERERDGRGSRSREDDLRRSWSRRDEPRQPPSRRGELQRSWSQRDAPRQPWSRRDKPQQPWSRRDEPQQPWDRRDEPRQPWSQRDESRRPWSSRDEPRQPWSRRDEPQRMPGRTRQAQRSWGRRDKPRQLMSRADEPQRPRSQRNRTERPWGVGNEEPRQRGRRRGGRRPWNLKNIKIARKLTKRKVRNGLRQRLAQERRAEKLKEGVSEASPSRKSEGQELKSTLARGTTNRETRVERVATRAGGVADDAVRAADDAVSTNPQR